MLGWTKTICIILASAAVLSGCTTKTYGPPEDSRPVEPQVELPAEPEVEASARPILPVEEFESLLAENLSYKDLLAKVAEPLAKYVLENLRKVDVTAHEEYFGAVRAYHQALIELAEKYPSETGTIRLHAQYERTILAVCANDPNNCQAFKLVAKEARASAVILNVTQIVKLTPEVKWNYSFMALDFSNVAMNEAAKAQFYANVEEYLQTRKGSQDKESLAQIKEAGRRISQIVGSANGSGPAIDKFLERMNIWSQDATNPALESLRSALWPTLMKNGPIRDGKMSPSFSRWMSKALTKFDQDVILPFRADSTMNKVWKAYQLRDPRAEDSYILFVLDQLYLGKIQRADAIALLGFHPQPLQRLLSVAQSFVQVRFAKQTYETHSFLKVALADRSIYETVTKLLEGLVRANPMEVKWAHFLERISVIRDVIDNSARGANADVPRVVREQIETTFGQMDRAIKWNVTYPNMLPVMYFISKSNLSQTFEILWSTVTLTSDSVFEMLFKGQLGMWFNFTNAMVDRSKFSTPEVLTSFRAALATGLFDNYKDAGLTPATFILETIDRLLTKTRVKLDTANESLYQSLFISQRYQSFGSVQTNVFMKATNFCRGERVPEVIKFKLLESKLVPFEEPLTDSMSNAALYNISIKNSGGTSIGYVADFTDQLRTDDIYFLDLVKKLRDIYAAYLAEFHLQDAQLAEIDKQIKDVDDRFTKLFGFLHFGSARYSQCQLKIMELRESRQQKAMQYEREYLRRAFNDLKAVQADPSLIDTINARYPTQLAGLGVEARDGVVATANGFGFRYSKPDFLMRLKGYLQYGFGEGRPAIAPGMEIGMPVNPMREDADFYNMLYDHSQEVTIELGPGEGEKAFLQSGFSLHFNQPGFMAYTPIREVNAFSTFYGKANSLGWIVTLGRARLKFQGELMKLGEVDVYDFEKEECKPTATFEQLNEKCRAKRNSSAQDIYDFQRQLAENLSIPDATVEIFKLTQTPSMYGDAYNWKDEFFSGSNGSVMGFMDSFLYMASIGSLGDNLTWPGTQGGMASPPPARPGLLDRARVYHSAFGSQSQGNLLALRPGLDGGIIDMYKGYVRKEFAQQFELENLAAKMELQPDSSVSIRFQMNEPLLTIPVRTKYVQPASTRQMTFDRQTDYIFAN